MLLELLIHHTLFIVRHYFFAFCQKNSKISHKYNKKNQNNFLFSTLLKPVKFYNLKTFSENIIHTANEGNKIPALFALICANHINEIIINFKNQQHK